MVITMAEETSGDGASEGKFTGSIKEDSSRTHIWKEEVVVLHFTEEIR
jgi:hypothetical protein